MSAPPPPPHPSWHLHKADDHGDKIGGAVEEVETPIETPAPDEDRLLDIPLQENGLTRQKSLESNIEHTSSLQLPKYNGTIRSASPDNLSILSTTSFDAFRHRSRSPAPPKSWRGRISAFWVYNKGVALVLLAQVFGTLMNVTTRLLELEGNNGKGMHPFQILFARMGITFILASLYMWWQKTPDFPFGAPGIRVLLVCRGLGGFFGVYGMYYSLLYLPLADATVITFLAPGIACWVCSYIIKEPFTRMEQMATFVSLLCVVLIARPTSFFHLGGGEAPPASGTDDVLTGVGAANGTRAEDAPLAADLDNVTPEQRLAGVAVAMVGVFGAVIAYTTIRWIGKRAHPLITVNYFACWCTIVSLSVMTFWPGVGFLFPANPKEWGYLVFLGVCGFVMQFLLAAGLQYEKSSRATNMIYTQMLWALAFDKLIFGSTPGLLSIAGSSLILGSSLWVAAYKGKTRDKEEQSRPVADEEQQSFLTEEPVERGRSFRMEGAAEGAPVEEVQLRTMRH